MIGFDRVDLIGSVKQSIRKGLTSSGRKCFFSNFIDNFISFVVHIILHSLWEWLKVENIITEAKLILNLNNVKTLQEE